MPWPYEQRFNTLATGDLNGQDSWSGNAIFDVSTTAPNEGDKCIAAAFSSDTFLNIARSFTATGTFKFYVSMKVNRTGGTAGKVTSCEVELYSGATQTFRLALNRSDSSGTIVLFTSEAGYWITLDAAAANNTWYRIGIEFDAVNQANKFRVNVNNGAWSSWYRYYLNPTWSTVDTIKFSGRSQDAGSTGTAYWDSISADYDLTPASIKTDTTAKLSNWASPQTTKNLSVTVGANSNRYLLGAIIHNQAQAPTGMTYGGVAMTLLGSTTAGTMNVWVYGLVAPATGANNMTVTFGDACSHFNMVALSLYNVFQQSPTVGVSTAYNDSSQTAVNATHAMAAPFGWLIDFIGLSSDSPTLACGSGQSLALAYASGFGCDIGVLEVPTPGTTTSNYTMSSDTLYGRVTLELRPQIQTAPAFPGLV